MSQFKAIIRLISPIFSRDSISVENLRYYFASQQVFLAAFMLHVLFLILFIWFEITELIYFNIISIIIFVYVLYLNNKGHHEIPLWLAYIEVHAHAALTVILLGWGAGFFYYLLAVGPMLFFYPRYSMYLKILISLVSVMILVILFLYSFDTPPHYLLNSEVLSFLYISNMISAFALLAYLAHYYTEGANKSEAQLRQLSSQFEKLAISDPLTGLLNRRAAIQQIEKEISRFNRKKISFVIVIGDIDNFKSYNDEYGHLYGDEVIKQVANTLLKNTRNYDVTSRWGGEEFLIILPDCSLNDAVKSIENLRVEISAHSIKYNNIIVNITMSFGISEFNEISDLESCLEAADKALYHGKVNGKNRVEIGIVGQSGEYLVGAQIKQN